MFLFGAGASAFSGAQAQNPPLGKDLFAALEAAGLAPPDLPHDVLELFRGQRNFELAMEALATRYDSLRYYPLLRGMARFFGRFEPLPDSQYIRLFRRLVLARARFAVATLNYDNLIEHSLAALGLHRPVIKPHGSCGFLPKLGGILTNVSAMGCETDFEGLETMVELRQAAIEQWCVDPAHGSIGPVMSFYAPDKPTKINRPYIQQHRDAWARAVADGDICVVVGVTCNPEDSHIWKPLAAAKCRLVFVNPEGGQYNELGA